jgi:hypothetical protein
MTSKKRTSKQTTNNEQDIVLPVSVLAASPSEPTKPKKAPKKIKRIADQERDAADDAIELAKPPIATKRMTNTLGPNCVPVVDASGAVVVSPIPEKVVEQRVEPPKVKAIIKDGIVTMVPDEY